MKLLSKSPELIENQQSNERARANRCTNVGPAVTHSRYENNSARDNLPRTTYPTARPPSHRLSVAVARLSANRHVVPRQWLGHVALPFHSRNCSQQIAKQNIGLRVPRFERMTSVVTRGTMVRGRCVPFLTRTPPSSNRQRSDKTSSNLGLINYKQMPINIGHPFGVHPGTSRSS